MTTKYPEPAKKIQYVTDDVKHTHNPSWMTVGIKIII